MELRQCEVEALIKFYAKEIEFVVEFGIGGENDCRSIKANILRMQDFSDMLDDDVSDEPEGTDENRHDEK